MSIELVISLLATLGLGGLLGAILNRRFEQQKLTNEHDVKIFNQSNELLGEQKISDIANFHLLSNHSLNDEDYYTLTRWCRFFEQTGNRYLDKKIEKENQRLVNDLFQLTDFIGYNFFTISGQSSDNKSQYLKPDWNPDRSGEFDQEKMKEYDKYAQELETLVEKVVKQYSVYRRVVKKQLKI